MCDDLALEPVICLNVLVEDCNWPNGQLDKSLIFTIISNTCISIIEIQNDNASHCVSCQPRLIFLPVLYNNTPSFEFLMKSKF